MREKVFRAAAAAHTVNMCANVRMKCPETADVTITFQRGGL